MSSATLTLIGLYNYDHTLFNTLSFPTGIDKNHVIDTILMRGGEYEVIYSNPDWLKQMFATWSETHAFMFEEWLRANEALSKVAPLENYDRIENWSDSASSSEHESLSSSESTSSSENNASSLSTSGSNSMSEQNNISADDSSTFVPKDASQSSGNNIANTTTNGNQNNTSNNQFTSNQNKNGTDYSVHGGRVHGNIGVTTSTQMWRDWQLALEQYGNIYERIAIVFLQHFVIPIL